MTLDIIYIAPATNEAREPSGVLDTEAVTGVLPPTLSPAWVNGACRAPASGAPFTAPLQPH